MPTRSKSTSLSGLALVAVGLALLIGPPARASIIPRLFFHSAHGGYAGDVQADPAGFASTAANPGANPAPPDGSTMDATAPTSGTDRTATFVGSGSSAESTGSVAEGKTTAAPTFPRFSFPHTGSLRSMCVELWFQANGAGATTVKVEVFSSDRTPTAALSKQIPSFATSPTDTSVKNVHVLETVTLPNAVTVTPGSYVAISLLGPLVRDVVFQYDSTAHPSSLAVDPAYCASQLGGSPSPTPTGTGGPIPTGSPTPEPTEEPTPCEGGDEFCDDVAPRMSSVSMRAKATVTESTLVSWAGTDPEPGSGIASYQVDVTTTTGSRVWSAAATAARSTTLNLKRGTAYKTSVSAVDQAGNRGPVKVSAPYYVPLDDTNFTLSKGWTKVSSASCWYRSFAKSATKGASATRKVTAKRYDLVFTASASGGIAEVYVNGKLVKRIDTYAKTATYRKMVTIASYSSNAARTIVVKVSGTRNRSSKGTYVYFDGLRAVY